MSQLCAGQQVRKEGESYLSRLTRLEREDREHAQAIYGKWSHPYNVHLNDQPRRRGPPARPVIVIFDKPSSRSISHAGFCSTCRRATVDLGHPEPPMPSPFKGRPEMAIQDRAWLRCRDNRDIVRRLWLRLESTRRSALGGYGNLDDEALVDEDGVPERIVSHWRQIDYRNDGSRVVTVPGAYVANDLETLGLSRRAIFIDTVEDVPLRCERCQPPPAPPRSRGVSTATNPLKRVATGRSVPSKFVREGSRGR